MKQEGTLLFVALDWRDEKKILETAEELSKVEGNFGYKVNLDYLTKPGRSPLSSLKEEYGRPVFADMKMANGKRTMISVVESLDEEEADFVNVYALMESELKKTIEAIKEKGIKVLGVTVLTHFDDRYCQRIFRRSLPETVRLFSEISVEVGCDGIILPGTTLEVVQDIDILKVVPGVRPEWYEEKDKRHEQEVTPAEAILGGAEIIVVGGPVTKMKDRCGSLKQLLEETEQAEIP